MPALTSSLRPESEVQPDKVWFRFLRLHQRMTNGASAQLKTLGLSVAQFDLISTLSEREGISQSELAERLYVTKGNVSGLVDRLVQAGLVQRRAIAGDRRSYAMHLTAEGRKLAEAGIALQQAYVSQTLGQLAPHDVAQLDLILRDWRDKVRALDPK
ncbi:MAG: MarR family winged helix-turn-helix transcriptional regulator [Bosea sp. (in: a-proteobacteria)]